MSTAAFVVGLVSEATEWIRLAAKWLFFTPAGTTYLMVFGLVWLSAIVWGPEDVGKMSEGDLLALRILGSDFKDFRAKDLASEMSKGGMPKSTQQAISHIDRLQKLGYARRSARDIVRGDHAYAITADGRAALAKRKLL